MRILNVFYNSNGNTDSDILLPEIQRSQSESSSYPEVEKAP